MHYNLLLCTIHCGDLCCVCCDFVYRDLWCVIVYGIALFFFKLCVIDIKMYVTSLCCTIYCYYILYFIIFISHSKRTKSSKELVRTVNKN